jgi:hypothetical protein
LAQPTIACGALVNRAAVHSSTPGHSPPESPPSSSNILRI